MNKIRKSTMVELVTELELISPKTELISEMINEAKTGEYHDFKNNKYVCGKVAVVEKLRKANLLELAKRVMEGEFDEVPDEEDEQMLKELVNELIGKNK